MNTSNTAPILVAFAVITFLIAMPGKAALNDAISAAMAGYMASLAYRAIRQDFKQK